MLGVSGRAMLAGLVEGTRDPAVLAEFAKGQLRKKLPQLREALEGRFRVHHALLVGELLAHIEYLEDAIERLSQEVERHLAPFGAEIQLLDTIPGIDRRAAEVILAEIGADMTRFPTARHLASWAGRCPGNHESAGKRGSGRMRKGAKWLAITLVECATSAARGKGTYLASQYTRIKWRRGHRKAVGAVAHSILTIAYHVLRRGRPYTDLGPNYLLLRDNAEAYTKRLVRQLERLGHMVTLAPLPIRA
jgi:transposase